MERELGPLVVHLHRLGVEEIERVGQERERFRAAQIQLVRRVEVCVRPLRYSALAFATSIEFGSAPSARINSSS
jgi:hypothetical protein